MYVFDLGVVGGEGGEGGEWIKRLGLDFTNPVETWGMWDLCLGLGVCSVDGELDWVWVEPEFGRLWWCFVCVSYEPGIFV